ncbi:hypothetical protein HQQ82_00900 [Rathayibacter sp. VKM Ac-2856]|uniref:hypothetical protein n=1 Tax=unclassified Rathayibacter TaxID=2609250 RepID=UPI001567C08F|nr:MULTISPECIES: hypothetical protein [unclassified Rathayibacter]NQX03353.1 hypothetical protein [Rathayibacter sp. VKM Ac-2858]NQX18521.1 hypothetical protein [Rathayibacter sp. VKM Ac-2856]
MGLFSRRRPMSGAADAVAVIADPATGRARVGADAVPILPLVLDDRAVAAVLARSVLSDAPILVPHASGLTVAPVLDRDGAWEYVTASTAARLGHTSESLAEEALAWLARIDPIVSGGDGRFLLETPPGSEELAASFILRAGFLHALFDEFVPGEPVVAIGQRVSMHVCGTEDSDAVAGLHELARALYDGGDAAPVSPTLYRLGADGSATPL